ncbi:MAG: hypothetical protein Q8Q02_09620 [Nocardioides sp.]|nr:hypothetical protein [Nocardioides sp.]
MATRDSVRPDHDRFGIRKLRPDRVGGMAWAADWEQARRFSGQDPADPWFDADHGSGSFRVADGMLVVSGPHPRMHVRHPGLARQWRDVEVTMYFRARRRGPAYAGMVAVARTNHGISGDPVVDQCDSRGLGARMRYDGVVDVEKETAHPANVVLGARRLWSGGLPLERWIGFKYLVRDQGPEVDVEVWQDLAEGADGGHWERVLSARDDGRSFGSVRCARTVDPRAALTGHPERLGSESGLPNLSVYFRTDGVGAEGLVYRWGSVREID